MLLPIGEFEYSSIITALRYSIASLSEWAESDKATCERVSDTLKNLKETERYITEFWNADTD